MASESDKEKAEQLKRDDQDVRRALEETAGNKPPDKPKVQARHKVWAGTYLILLIGLGVLYYFVRHNIFGFPDDYLALDRPADRWFDVGRFGAYRSNGHKRFFDRTS